MNAKHGLKLKEKAKIFAPEYFEKTKKSAETEDSYSLV